MITFAFSVLDTKTGHFSPPFFVRHRGEAIRMIIDVARDQGTSIGRHPADFALCEVGSFDDQTAQFTSNLVQMGTVLSLMPAPAQALPLFQAEKE